MAAYRSEDLADRHRCRSRPKATSSSSASAPGRIAELLGFERQDQTRIATAVSEIARNAFGYAGGGRAEFMIDAATTPQRFAIRISRQGPGIANLQPSSTASTARQAAWAWA